MEDSSMSIELIKLVILLANSVSSSESGGYSESHISGRHFSWEESHSEFTQIWLRHDLSTLLYTLIFAPLTLTLGSALLPQQTSISAIESYFKFLSYKSAVAIKGESDSSPSPPETASVIDTHCAMSLMEGSLSLRPFTSDKFSRELKFSIETSDASGEIDCEDFGETVAVLIQWCTSSATAVFSEYCERAAI